MRPPDDTPSALYDWNAPPPRRREIDVADATLCDGLLGPSVLDPTAHDKRRLLTLMSELGLRSAALGHPGHGTRQFSDALDLARELMRAQWPIDASCGVRANAKEVASALEVRERSGLDVELAVAVPVSPIRLEAEAITITRLQETTESALTFALRAGARVIGVLEDASRTPPELLAFLIRHLLALGASAIRVCDSVGHASPDGTRALITFALEQVTVPGGRPVRLEWQGQNDRGLALANALAAIESGAHRVHASALGLGERSGTVPMELLLTNLRLTGQWPHTLGALTEYCESAAAAFGVAIAPAHAVVGSDAYRSGNGAHATALVRALRAGDRWMAENVCSAVPASLVGAEQQVDVSPVSGPSNVRWWLSRHGYDAADMGLMREMLLTVKQTQRASTDDELRIMADDLLAARAVRI